MTDTEPCKVLIVEDSAVFRQLLKSALCSHFPTLDVIEAEDLADGHRKACQHRPAVVFVDIRLPDGNGLDLAERIRQDRLAGTVAVCTSHDLPEYRQAALQRGASLFLAKQCLDWDEVVSFAEEALARKTKR